MGERNSIKWEVCVIAILGTLLFLIVDRTASATPLEPSLFMAVKSFICRSWKNEPVKPCRPEMFSGEQHDLNLTDGDKRHAVSKRRYDRCITHGEACAP